MTTWQQIRKKARHSGLAMLGALLLVSANPLVPFAHSTAYAATGPVTLSGSAGNAQVTLNWEAVPDATGYDVYRNGTKVTSTPITSTTYVDTAVVNGTTYSYTASAILAGASSAQSNTVSLMPQSPPGLLRGLATTTGVTNLTDGNNATFTTFPINGSQTIVLPTPAKVTGLNAYGHTSMQIKLYDTDGALVGTYTPSYTPVNPFTSLNLQHVAKIVLTNTYQSNSVNMYDLELTGIPDANTSPTGFVATPSNAQVSLNWGAVDGVTEYNLYRNGLQSSNKINSAPLTGNTFTDTNVINGNTYLYYLAPITPTGEGLISKASALPQPPAGLLRGLATTTGETNLTDGNNATFTTLPSNGSQTIVLPTPAKVTGLNAYGSTYMQIKLYDTDGALVGTHTPSDTPVNPFTALNLQHVAKVVITNTYQYKALNMNDLELTGIPDANTSPTGFVAAPGNAQVSLNWGVVDGVTEYNLYRNGLQSSNKINSAPLTGNTFTDTNVINGNTYLYYLAPITPTGEGLISKVSALPQSPAGLLRGLATTTGETNLTDGNNATFTTLPSNGSQTFVLPTPAKVTGLNAYGSTYMQIKLYDTVGALLGTYTPSDTPVNPFIALNLQNVAKVEITNTYQYKALNMHDVELNGVYQPNAPVGLTGTAGDSQATLTWTASPSATGYNLYRDGVKLNESPLTDTTYLDTGLVNATHYAYFVTALNVAGESAHSNTVDIMPAAPLPIAGSPSDLTGTAGDSQVALNWTASEGAESYNVYRDGVKINTAPLTDTTYTDNGLVNGTHYAYYVTAINTAGESAPSNTVNVVPTAPLQIPGSPSDLTGTAGDAQAVLNWTSTEGAESYDVYRDGLKINTAPVTTNTYTDTGLTNGTTYTYYVTAVNATGESEASNTISVTPQAAVAPVVNLLSNSSFENGTASDTAGLQVGNNWKFYVAPGATPDLAVVTSPVYSGTYAQKVSGSGIPNGNAIDVYQLVAAEANTAYTVSGMYNIESLNNAFVQLYVDFYDIAGHFIKSNIVRYDLTTPNYVQLTNRFTTPDNTGSFRVYSVLRASADNASGTFYVDDLSVVKN